MYIPEYTITGGILKNIAEIEYSKAVIDTTTILPTLERQLQKEAEVSFIYHNLRMEGLEQDEEEIKKYVDNIGTSVRKEVKNLYDALNLAGDISKSMDLEEKDIKNIYKELIQSHPTTAVVTYRTKEISGRTSPEEILAETVELMDWYNSLDSRDTHPIIRAGIMKGRLEQLMPFDRYVQTMGSVVSRLVLASVGYEMNGYVSPELFYTRSKRDYEQAISSILSPEPDLTQWLEYYAEALTYTAANVRENVLLLARDTKIAKASGNVDITPRQERIVEYLQDYGIIKNKDFGHIFPDVSEDSVLRDLKVLMDKGIVVKKGKTKSSRYELS